MILSKCKEAGILNVQNAISESIRLWYVKTGDEIVKEVVNAKQEDLGP